MVRLEGFDELIQFLTDAPQAIRDEGMTIIREETEGAAVEIAHAYAIGPTRKVKGRTVQGGTLARRVTTSFPSTTLLVGIVQSSAPHAHLWEFGTKQRQTASGANRGVMPAHKGRDDKVTPKIAEKHRARMYRRLREMVSRMGFQVSGE